MFLGEAGLSGLNQAKMASKGQFGMIWALARQSGFIADISPRGNLAVMARIDIRAPMA